MERLNRAKDARINELEGQLKINSKNSQLPPSSDRFSNKIRSVFNRKQDKQKVVQKGHDGKTLYKVEFVNEVIVLAPQRCQCGLDLSSVKREIIETRQEFDIHPVDIYKKEYQLKEWMCPNCSVAVRGIFPQNILAPNQYGSAIGSLCVVLSVYYKMPLANIVQLMEDIYKVSINESIIINWLKQAYHLLETTEDQIKGHLTNSKLLHADETGINIGGKNYWNHVVSNEKLTYQFVHEKRGQQALLNEASIIPFYIGILVHDCWSSYFAIDQVQHAVCGVHLQRA